jgi:hypothetical protein
MEYGQALPDDEIRSIMGRAIPQEWTVNLLVMDKEPWKFKDVDDQLSTYHQQWQSDLKKCQRWRGSPPEDQAKVDAKIMSEAPTTKMVAPAAAATKILDEEIADEDKDAEATEEIIMTIIIL